MHTPIIGKERQICCTKRKGTLHTIIKLTLNSQIIRFYWNSFNEIIEIECSFSRINLLLQRYSILFTIIICCIKILITPSAFKQVVGYNHCNWLLCYVCIQFLICRKSQTLSLSITFSTMNLQFHHFYLFDYCLIHFGVVLWCLWLIVASIYTDMCCFAQSNIITLWTCY